MAGDCKCYCDLDDCLSQGTAPLHPSEGLISQHNCGNNIAALIRWHQASTCLPCDGTTSDQHGTDFEATCSFLDAQLARQSSRNRATLFDNPFRVCAVFCVPAFMLLGHDLLLLMSHFMVTGDGQQVRENACCTVQGPVNMSAMGTIASGTGVGVTGILHHPNSGTKTKSLTGWQMPSPFIHGSYCN